MKIDRTGSAFELFGHRLCRPTVAVGVLLMVSGCFDDGVLFTSDRDQDGIGDQIEQSLGTNPLAADSDGDGLTDGDELAGSTSPFVADSDFDGVIDSIDEDPGAASPGNRISSGNDIEPNDTLDHAVWLDRANPDQMLVSGRIDPAYDLDVFELGRLDAGDIVAVESNWFASSLDPVVALLDGEGASMRIVRPRPPLLGDTTLIIRHTARETTERCYLAVAGRHASGDFGDYELVIAIERGGALPAAEGQIVYLDFGGGTPDSAILEVGEVGPLEGADISPAFAESTELIIEWIKSTVRDRFDDFDVQVMASDEQPEPEGRFSRLLIGAAEARAFGAAQSVDAYNLRCCDDGLVFSESFRSESFGFTPPPEAIGVAMGNVAAHEIGHLLGLHHVTDYTALMDEASPAIVLLFEQQFKAAPLSPSVFPIGHQDAPALLANTVGVR